MGTSRRTAAAAAGAGMVALSAGTAVRTAARRIGRRPVTDVDDLLSSPPESDVRTDVVATSDGGRIHLVSAGPADAPLVLLCHGVLLRWWVWNPLFHLLANDHRLVAWDMRGHGRSHSGTRGVTMGAVGTDLVEVLEHLGTNPAVVVGHSMGGMAALRAAIDHEDRLLDQLSGLVLTATSADALTFRSLSGSATALIGGLGRVLGRPDAALPFGPADLATVAVRMSFGSSPSSRAVDQVRRMVASTRRSTSVEAARAIAQFEAVGRLGSIDVPTSIVVGTDDRLTPSVHARRLKAELTGTTPSLFEFDGCGHQVMQERPTDLADVIRHHTGVTAKAKAG